MAIRQQRPRGKLPLPKLDPSDQDPNLDIRHVTDKYPKTKESPWLVERLVKFIAKRREYILFLQQHQKRLEAPDDYRADAQSLFDHREAPSTIATTYEDPAAAQPDMSSQPTEGARIRRASSVWSKATTLATRPGADGDEELYFPELSNLVFKGVQLQYDEPFVCPFCQTAQNVGNYSEWS
jgi:hypothetical protein